MPALLTIVLIINVIIVAAMVFPLLNSDSLYKQAFHRVTRVLLRAMLIGSVCLPDGAHRHRRRKWTLQLVHSCKSLF